MTLPWSYPHEFVVIPGYTITSEVGRGLHSVVYRAQRGNRQFAIKMPHTVDSTVDPLMYAHFQREASALALVQHPSLPTVVEINQINGIPYIVMDYVQGSTLLSVLGLGALSETTVLMIAKTLASALAAVHRQGVIHRDIQPRNILINGNNDIKLIDFGFASYGTSENDTNQQFGTLQYSSPEQTGYLRRPVDARSDLYSLGIVLFECLTGAPPFTASNTSELLRAHAMIIPPDVRTNNPYTSPAFALIIAKLLAKDPDDRYQTAEGLLSDLDDLDSFNTAIHAGRSVVLDSTNVWTEALYEEPLIGRDRELNLMRQSWALARRGQGTLVLIESAMGLGKSHLGRELLHRARSNGGLVLMCSCSKDQSPYTTIRVVLDQYLRYMTLMPKSQRQHAESQIQNIIAPYNDLIVRTFPELERFVAVSSAPTLTYDQELFNETLAHLLLWITMVHPAAVLLLDDAQAMDEASTLVIRQVLARMSQSPLLMIATLGEDAVSKTMRERLTTNHTIPTTSIVLMPLDEVLARSLISACLGGYQVDEAINREIIARSAGSPFAIRQYVQTLLDAGMLRLVDGMWLIDEADLATLQLPSHVVPLVLSRVDDLDPVSRDVLSIAAMLGFQFRRQTLVDVWYGTPDLVNTALETGIQRHLIERNTSGSYHFSHQNVYQLFLRGIDLVHQRVFHERIALALDAPTSTLDDDQIYQLAHHYYHAKSDDPYFNQRGYDLLIKSARLAVANYAFQEAYDYLKHAQEIAQREAITINAEDEALFADVCLQRGSISEALAHLERASMNTEDTYERARLQVKQVILQSSSSKREDILAAFCSICRDLGVPFPTSRSGLLADIAQSNATLVAQSINPKAKSITSQERIRLQVLADLYENMNYFTYIHNYKYELFASLLRLMIVVGQLGTPRETLRMYCHTAMVAIVFRLPSNAQKYLEHAQQIAEQLSLPSALAEVSIFRGYVLSALGQYRESTAQLKATLNLYEHDMNSTDFCKGCADIVMVLFMRGYVAEAWEWNRRGLQRTIPSTAYTIESLSLHSWAAPLLISLGDPVSAKTHLLFPEHVESANEMHQTVLCFHRLIIALEQEDYGDRTDELIEQFLQYHEMHHNSILLSLSYHYIPILYLRLAQAQQANDIKRPWAIRRLATILEKITDLRRSPLLDGHVLVVEAGHAYLSGNINHALEKLAQAETIAYTIEAPWILFEAKRVRSHALARMGHNNASRREAMLANQLANEHSWSTRSRRIVKEFTLDEYGSFVPAPILTSDANRPETLKVRRHLDALLKVSLAWANVLDPQQQMQIALDSVIRILGAERALLFLVADEQLVLRAGRDAHGNDIGEPDSESSNMLIEQVYVSQKPLVVSNAAEATGHHAGQVSDQKIRSIVAAPLMLDGKCLGVIYLDNRLAWGFFSQDDVEILQAITNHVVVGLETARTAQLEISIVAEREQRRLAETMRHISTVLNSTLDLSKVLEEALAAVAELIPYDSGGIALVDEDSFEFVALRGHVNSEMLKHQKLLLADDPLFSEMSHTLKPLIINDIESDHRFKGYGRNTAKAWLGVPLIVQQEVVGFIGLDRNRAFSITERDAEIAMTFAAQASIAITNARLFGEVQRLAISDGLTEIFNRRYFFELGEHEWKRTRRYDHPLSAMMIDVDYFKRINDNYSHATGDLVLRTVAQTCRANLRETDILGRYGGEEFAVLLPDTDVSAALLTAERLRHAIAELVFQTDRGEVYVTASIGVAGITDQTDSVAELLDRADRGLYIAKEAGRNRVMMA